MHLPIQRDALDQLAPVRLERGAEVVNIHAA